MNTERSDGEWLRQRRASILSQKRLAMALSVIAVMLLGACAPTIGTPEATIQAQVVPATQAVVTNPPASTSPAQAVLFKSKDPTTFTYLQSNIDPTTLDPALDYETSGGGIAQNTYDTLIFYNKDDANTFVPQLATDVPSLANGGVSADGKTYTFKIRTGVKFHSGDPLTPADVAFTFQRGLLQGGLHSPQWLLFQPILGIDASSSGNNDITDLVDPSGKLGDDRADLVKADRAKLAAVCDAVVKAIVADDAANTVTFHLAQPWGPFLATLAGTWGSIQDKKWIGANGGWDGDCQTWQNFYSPAPEDLNKTKVGSGENGTGPYVLDHWTRGHEIVLKAFDGYWRNDPAWAGGPTGAPKLKTIIIRSVLQFAARLAALHAGDADIVDPSSPSDWVQMDTLVGEVCDQAGNCNPSSQASNPLRVFKGLPSISRQDLFMNFAINTTGGNDFIGSGQLDGNGIPPDFFSDMHVRKAFNYCFDWDTYIKDVLLGEGTQSFDVMLPGEIGYGDQDPHYSYDPARCRSEFLASTLKSAVGKSLWDTGFRLTITYNSGITSRQVATQILAQDLARVNPKFVVDVTGLPWPTFLAAQNAHQLPILINGWLEDIHDPHDWAVPYSTGTYGESQSLPLDLVKTLGALVNQGVLETDPARRAAIYKQFNQAFYDAAPDILLAVQTDRHYEQRWLQGYYSNPIYSSFYYYALSKQ